LTFRAGGKAFAFLLIKQAANTLAVLPGFPVSLSRV
jgi:hypothetical protein